MYSKTTPLVFALLAVGMSNAVQFADDNSYVRTCNVLEHYGKNFAVWPVGALSSHQCHFTDLSSGKTVHGTCRDQTTCKMNGGWFAKAAETHKYAFGQNCTGPQDDCCVLELSEKKESRACKGKPFVGKADGSAFPEQNGICTLPSYCAVNVPASNVSSLSCKAVNDLPQTCCNQVDDPTTKPMYTKCLSTYMHAHLICEKRMPFYLDSFTRLTNFLPFVIPRYEYLETERCAPLGDCSAAQYMAFAMFTLLDFTSYKPQAQFDKFWNKLSSYKDLNPEILTILREASAQGQMTPRAFGRFLDLIWADKDLNLEQFNSGSCADWIRIGAATKGEGNEWKCNDMWEGLTEGFNCKPTHLTNLGDCANGAGVCTLSDTHLGGDHQQCDAKYNGGQLISSSTNECTKYHKEAVCCSKKQSFETTMSFAHNEYRNVRISISPDVPEDPKLLERLIAVLRNVSSGLYPATEKRATITSYRIILPNHWDVNLANTARTNEQWREAEFIIGEDVNSTFLTRPKMTTVQAAQCGTRGHGTYLSPKSLNYAISAVNMIKHFAFNIYGIFTEFPRNEEDLEIDSSKPLYKQRVPRCVDHGDVNYFYCDEEMDPHWDAQVGHSTDIAASIAWLPPFAEDEFHTDMIQHFCDSRICDKTRYHNYDMLNTHNRVCNRLPTFDVILASQDFAGTPGDYNSVPPRQDLQIDPVFHIVHENFGKKEGIAVPESRTNNIVLVIDASDSMTDDRKLRNVQAAASQFVELTDSTMKVAIVSFHDQATTQIDFTDGSYEGRNKLYAAIAKITIENRATCIQSGVNKALELLEATGMSGGQIVLISDSDNNLCTINGKPEDKPDFIDDVKDGLRKQGAVVHTIAITQEADDSIEELAKMTGGKSYFVPVASKLIGYIEAFQSLFVYLTESSAISRVAVTTFESTISGNGEKEFQIMLEEGLTEAALISVYYRADSPIDVNVISQGGSATCAGNNEFSKTSCWIFNSQPGKWLVRVQGLTSKQAGFVISVMAAVRNPIAVSAVTKATSGDKKSYALHVGGKMTTQNFYIGKRPDNNELWIVSKETQQVVTATVSYGPFAVLNAEVVATVHTPSGKKRGPFKCVDDGKNYDDKFAFSGMDLEKNDGIYTCYFAVEKSGLQSEEGILEEGRYAVNIEVAGTDETFYSDSVLLGHPRSDKFLARISATHKKIAFNRELQVGTFKVSASGKVERRKRSADSVKSIANVLAGAPPARVNQLRIASVVQKEEGTMYTLSWPAVGNNGMVGKPSYYFLNATTDFRDAAGRGFEIAHSPLFDGRLVVAKMVETSEDDMPGVAKTASVFLPKPQWSANRQVFFSVVAVNRMDSVMSVPSNIVISYIPETAPEGYCRKNGDCTTEDQLGGNVVARKTRSAHAHAHAHPHTH